MKFDENARTVILEKSPKESFGIAIVKGEKRDSSANKISGIFIKDIIANTPAQRCGKLKVGDRILQINENDVRDATEQMFIGFIKSAGMSITLRVQTLEQPMENGYLSQNGEISRGRSIKKTSAPPVPSGGGGGSGVGTGAGVGGANDDDDEEEDTREMTGRIRTAAGMEIDRASAGNAKLSAAQKAADTEQEDEFGYTEKKIKKRYGNLGPVHKTEVLRPPNTDMGIALAGHKDRQMMACVIAGINPNGIATSANLKPGDEVLEVNGNVLQDRCHLNATSIFKKIGTEKIVFIILRRPPNKQILSIKPVTQFPVTIDGTKHLFESYKNVKLVQVQKSGPCLGIMVIEGKHSEVGQGIFISDLQEGSNAANAGIHVGDLLLAVNKDVVLDTSYESVVALIKRTQGIVNLIICALKTEDEIKKEEEKKEQERLEKEKRRQEEAEKPQDPTIAEIRVNRKTQIEIKCEKKALGCILVGGKNSYVTTGCIVANIYKDGVIAKDNRLRVFDQILDINGDPIKANEMTALKIYQLFLLPYEKITLNVWRNDPPEVEILNIDVARKPGKDLGMALVENPKGACISEIISAGCADIDSRLQRGDIISKLNGESLEGLPLEVCYALFRQATGKVSLEISRPKPTARN